MSKYVLNVCICNCMYNGEIMHVVTNFIRKRKGRKTLKLKEKQGRKEMKPTICSQQQTNHKIHYY